MRIHTSRGPSASYLGMVIVAIGTVLLMIAERPEFRPQPSQGASPSGKTIAALGQGSTTVGAAILGYRAIAFVRRQGRGRNEELAEASPVAQVKVPEQNSNDHDSRQG